MPLKPITETEVKAGLAALQPDFAYQLAKSERGIPIEAQGLLGHLGYTSFQMLKDRVNSNSF